jgi:hypothetical protein
MCRIRVFLAVLIVVLAGGCATRPENLKKPERADQIVLEEMISIVAYRGLNVRCEEGLLPGTYVATYEDSAGVYYFGEGRSIWNTNELIQKVPRLSVGGIFMPIDKSAAPRFFYVFEKEVHTTGNINEYVQQRIVSSINTPGLAPVGAGVGVTVAGNVIAGALIDAMISSNVGALEMYPPISDEKVKAKILSSWRTVP